MNNRLAGSYSKAFDRLEPCAGKLASTVLRGVGSSDTVDLPDFAFVSRQQRIQTDTKHFYIDLVFYNYILKCFVLIDLKIGELTHQDVGQMDMYVRMYDDKMKNEEDNPTVGIILCEEKDNTVVRYSVLNGNEQLFASKYKLYLPSEKELQEELNRERELIEREKKLLK